MKKNIKIRLVIFGIVLFTLIVIVSIVGKTYIPKVSNDEGLPEDRVREIISVEQGYYNARLPFFSSEIEILENTNDYILYRVYYFPFGSIERSYTKEADGNWIFNLERPLFPT